MTKGSIEKLLSPADAAERLGVAIHTLSVWRCTRRYPLPYVKVGRLVKYREADIEAFIESRMNGQADDNIQKDKSCSVDIVQQPDVESIQ